jgi:hypothetical protein
MTAEIRNILTGLVLACLCLGWLARDAWAQEPNSEYLKQILRLQTTEFCATVGKPPQVIADALNKALEQDPKTWLPAVLWWNKLHEKYEKARCGDA